MELIKKITDLNYKRACEFNNKDIRKQMKSFIGNECEIENFTYYVKIIGQTIQYEMIDDSVVENNISLIIFLLVDTALDEIADCFCAPIPPTVLRVSKEFQVLRNLYKIYESDLKEIIKNDDNIASA